MDNKENQRQNGLPSSKKQVTDDDAITAAFGGEGESGYEDGDSLYADESDGESSEDDNPFDEEEILRYGALTVCLQSLCLQH